MVAVLVQVKGVPVLSVGDAEDEINVPGDAAARGGGLPFCHGFGGVRMR